MKILLFSKSTQVSDYLKIQLLSLNSNEMISSGEIEFKASNTFSELGKNVLEEHDLLIFHLNSGEEEETLFYRFINLYKQTAKVMVLANVPDENQGLRILKSGIRAYANTHLSEVKLASAIETILQGKVWVGDNVLNKLALNEIDDSNTSTLNEKSEILKTEPVSYREKMKETNVKAKKLIEQNEISTEQTGSSSFFSKIVSKVKTFIEPRKK